MYLAIYDNDRKLPFATKVTRAAARYEQKFGHAPAVCLVSPADYDRHAVSAAEGLPLRPSHRVDNNCFWLGGDDGKAL